MTMAKAKTAVHQELTARLRAIKGTRSVRRLRQDHLVPAVVYGKATQPLTIAVSSKELLQVLRTKAGEHALVTLRVTSDGATGKAVLEKPALIHAIQHDPVDGHILHVDFHAIVLTERLRVKVPIILEGESVGVKQEGGVLEHFLREVEVACLPTEIPAGIEVDVSALKIGEVVHVRSLVAPQRVQIMTDPEAPVASVQKPKEEKIEEAPAVTEPEVIREKKEEIAEAAEEASKGEPAAGKPDKDAKAGSKDTKS